MVVSVQIKQASENVLSFRGANRHILLSLDRDRLTVRPVYTIHTNLS